MTTIRTITSCKELHQKKFEKYAMENYSKNRTSIAISKIERRKSALLNNLSEHKQTFKMRIMNNLQMR